MRVRRLATLAGSRGHSDNSARTLPLEVARGEVATKVDAGEVHVDCLLPASRIEHIYVAAGPHAGVGDQDIDAAECLDSRFEKSAHVVEPRDVRLDRNRAPASRTNLFRDIASLAFVSVIVQNQRRSGFGESESRCGAYP